MTEQDYMNGPDIKAECKKAVKNLTKDNTSLDTAKSSVQSFIDDTEIKSDAFDALKKQLDDYVTIIDGLRAANLMDISDWNTFSDEVDDVVYVGKYIIAHMESYDNSRKAAEQRAEGHRNDRDNTDNIFMKAYYQFLVWEDEDDVDTYTRLYNAEKAKADRYDEIEAATSNLFTCSDDTRRAAKTGLGYLGKRFQGGQYTTPTESTYWKTQIERSKIDYSNSTNKGVSDGYLPISYYDEHGNLTYSYGGDQGWFKEFGDGSDLDKAIANHGCGIIALINFFYYTEGVTEVTREEYMQRVRDFVNSHPGIKKKITEGNTGIDTVGVPGGDSDLQNILNDYVKKHGYSSAKWQVFGEDYLERIESQLDKGIPVILQLGLGGMSKSGVVFYVKDNNGFKKSDYENVNDHYVTVTGVQKDIDWETGEEKTYLEISSWGVKYYIDYEEFLKLKEAGYEGNLFDDIENKGYCNISVVK